MRNKREKKVVVRSNDYVCSAGCGKVLFAKTEIERITKRQKLLNELKNETHICKVLD